MSPNSTKRSVAAGMVILAMSIAPLASGAVVFRDTFDRADGRNIDASLTGITDNTGSSLAIDGVYSQPQLDANNETGGEDGNPGNGGGAQILSNRLQLAVGPGTSNAFVNHNFTNAEILSDGGFTVSLDVTGFDGGSNGQGAAFAVGMTQAEAASTGDAFEGAPNDAKMTNAFPADFMDTVSDFWVGLRGDGSGELAWGHGAVGVGDVGNGYFIADVDAKTGTISATFQVSDFNAGSAVNYEVFYNGTSMGTGTFNWSDTDANYIGIDARDGVAVGLDNFVVSTIPEPATAVCVLIGVAVFGLRRPTVGQANRGC